MRYLNRLFHNPKSPRTLFLKAQSFPVMTKNITFKALDIEI